MTNTEVDVFCKIRVVYLLMTVLLAGAAYAGTGIRVLVPVWVDTPLAGANGSMWQTELAIYNNSGSSYVIKTCEPSCESQTDDEELLRGETQQGLPHRFANGSHPGVVLHFFPANPSDPDPSGTITLQSRVRDLSRNASSAGTEVPVVPESEFRSRKLQLLNIPVDPRFRLLLRLYEMNHPASTSFTVRVIDADSGASLVQRRVDLAPAEVNMLRPAYAQVSDIFNGLPANVTRVRVEVEPDISPAPPAVAFWGFVTVTNNTTQELTVISPQDLDVIGRPR